MPKKIIIAGAGLDGQPVTITGLPGTPLEGQSKSVLVWGTPPAAGTNLTALGGRIAVFDQAITNPSAGEVVARADGKTTLNLRGVTSAQTITAMIGGVPGQIEVSQIGQAEGFASGEGYWLAQDSNGRFAPTPGRRHRKIYVSGSTAAMSVAMIAAHAGVAESAVTGAWLAARPIYGGSEGMSLAWDAYALLAANLWGGAKESRSDWVRFERGYSYPQLRMGTQSGSNYKGESELHPLVFEAYGTGAAPIMGKVEWPMMGPNHIVIRDFATPVSTVKQGGNIIFEDIDSYGHDYFQAEACHSVTLKGGSISDHYRLAPKDNALSWAASRDRLSGSLFSLVTNVIAIGVLVDYNAWREGYDPLSKGTNTSPMPPSYYSHGLYWTHNNRNLTLRDLIVSRNASCGFQIRCGGYFERILFLYNNIAFGGDSEPYTNFTTLLDSVTFGSGHKPAVEFEGAIAVGYDLYSNHPVQLGCIVAHDADPDNPAERAARTSRQAAFRGQVGGPSGSSSKGGFADTQAYNWNGVNTGVEGLSTALLNNTTIQKLGGEFMGQPSATMDQIMAYLKANLHQVSPFVRFAIAKAKANFGRPLPVLRTTPATLTFLPNEHCEGFRWDNRRNWSTEDLPGTHVADSVDLDGNFVRFGTLTASIAALTSKGGILDVTSGKLTVGAIPDAAAIRVRGSGQIVIPATTQPLSVMADSGLTQITGAVTKADIEVRGHAEVLLGPDCTVPAGKSLVISGQRPLVGWDGTGSATLTIAGTLEFRAGLMFTTNVDTSTGAAKGTGQMITGNEIVGANFKATLADFESMASSNHRVWVSDPTGLPIAGEDYKFGVAQLYADKTDQILTVTALASRGLSMLQRFRSGTIDDGLTEPTVSVSLVLAAGSQVVIGRRDLLLPGAYDLTGPGITLTDQGATLPAGVSVTGGKLVLTVS